MVGRRRVRRRKRKAEEGDEPPVSFYRARMEGEEARCRFPREKLKGRI
jgi:hypothetical protein